jgi:hypothetical protein
MPALIETALKPQDMPERKFFRFSEINPREGNRFIDPVRKTRKSKRLVRLVLAPNRDLPRKLRHFLLIATMTLGFKWLGRASTASTCNNQDSPQTGNRLH